MFSNRLSLGECQASHGRPPGLGQAGQRSDAVRRPGLAERSEGSGWDQLRRAESGHRNRAIKCLSI